MRLTVLTPEGTLFDQDGLSRIRIPLADGGSIGIWPRHHPLLAQSVAGEVQYGSETYEHALDLQEGILHIEKDQVTLYTSGLRGEEGFLKPSARPDQYERLTQSMLTSPMPQQKGRRKQHEE